VSDWEVWDSDEDAVEAEEETVEEDEEVVEEDEEVVTADEEVVAKPEGDAVELYAYGLSSNVPKTSDTRRWLEWVQAYRQYKGLAGEARRRGNGAAANRYDGIARRYGDLAFNNCPYRPHRCPLYSFATKCPVGMEKACRSRAWRTRKPRRIR